MSKQTRAQKREEERRIIEEMERAMAESRGETLTETPAPETPTPETAQETPPDTQSQGIKRKLYCRRCKSEMNEKGVCPVCGYRVYVEMDESKRKKIRIITASVCLVIFVLMYFLLK